jgi:hypothetical protein
MYNDSVQRFDRLIASDSVSKFMAQEPFFDNDPAQVVADAIHYCDYHAIDFKKNVESARILREHKPYTGPVQVLSDLMRWCETYHHDWNEVMEKAEFYVEFDKGDISILDCIMA